MTSAFKEVASLIRDADALLIGAGAGMSVDSGLPDFRGNEGFWKAYPAFQGKSFAEVSNPEWFQTDPEQAWGFFGHRLNLYRNTQPHEGYEILRKWSERLPTFVYTSNVDGAFVKAGFNPRQVIECHGSIYRLQCSRRCCPHTWENKWNLEVDPETIRCLSPVPICIFCGEVARPNILMFGDTDWSGEVFFQQYHLYGSFLFGGKKPLVLEIGSGTAIRTVRDECEMRAGRLVRINPREAEVSPEHISIKDTAVHALKGIDAELRPKRRKAKAVPQVV